VKRDRPGMSPNFIIYLSRVLVSVVSPILISCGTLLYAFYFNNQTDQGEEREGLDIEGLEMEDSHSATCSCISALQYMYIKIR
jgi:hypothetical protein